MHELTGGDGRNRNFVRQLEGRKSHSSTIPQTTPKALQPPKAPKQPPKAPKTPGLFRDLEGSKHKPRVINHLEGQKEFPMEEEIPNTHLKITQKTHPRLWRLRRHAIEKVQKAKQLRQATTAIARVAANKRDEN